jgi:hypothetical protein
MNRAVRAGEVLDVARFEAMSREDCIDEWRRTMGGQSLKYISVQFMRSVMAYEAQIEAYGGHPSAVRKALKAALKTDQRFSEAGGRPKAALQSSLRAGTHLVREWNGRTYQIEVLDDGFQMDGKRYRSLSAIARKITGAHWSGPRFFGLG